MKKSKILPFVLTTLLLTSCSLARAEEAAPGSVADRFIGFYVIHTDYGMTEFYDNPNLEEYGTFTAESDRFGTVGFPREVLFAAEDAAGNLIFPGMEGGYSLLCYEADEEYGRASHMVSNMAPGEKGNAINVSDEGTANIISGTIYFGPPLNAVNWDPYETDGAWHFCRVYQAPDGRVYTDGSGNSVGGGGGCGYSETRTYTTAQNGESATDSIEASVKIEIIPRLERLVVTQFDGANAIIRSDDLALRDDLPEVACDPAAAWVLVEEVSAEDTVRTIYNVPAEDEDPISHTVILLDDNGLGHLAYLTIQ